MKKVVALGIVIVAVLGGALGYYYYTTTSNVVRIGYQPSDHHAAFFVAMAKKMFEKEGIKVETYEFKAGPPETQALAAGKIDVAYIGCVPAITAYSKGVPIKIVAGVNQEGSAIVVRKDEAGEIKGIKDLKGKRVAELMKGSIQDCMLRIALKRAGLDPDKDVDIVEMKTADAVNALGAKQIDAFIEPEPGPAMAVKKGFGVRLMDTGKIWPHHQCCVLVMRKDFIERHPDLARKVLRVHVMATKYVQEHPDDAAKITANQLKVPEEVEREAMRHVRYSVDLNVDSIKMFARFLKQLGYIKKLPDWSDFIDLKLLKEVAG
ncbi:aliphatic sulfonate ABC transporter substrate-binding protein [Methanopyrus sp.]